jgi:hypothetical protein
MVGWKAVLDVFSICIEIFSCIGFSAIDAVFGDEYTALPMK